LRSQAAHSPSADTGYSILTISLPRRASIRISGAEGGGANITGMNPDVIQLVAGDTFRAWEIGSTTTRARLFAQRIGIDIVVYHDPPTRRSNAASTHTYTTSFWNSALKLFMQKDRLISGRPAGI
jgi:hypothetical protein